MVIAISTNMFSLQEKNEDGCVYSTNILYLTAQDDANPRSALASKAGYPLDEGGVKNEKLFECEARVLFV